MKQQGNPVIEHSHRPEHAHLFGQKLLKAQASAGDELLDVTGRIGYQRKHRRRPFFTNHTTSFRCIAVYPTRSRSAP